ncbi:hypothetical protein KGF57_000031 [Candida theae]|uniref:Uncharacterized protein n=1 Tax=Candida theae TaxID=1198502 RepID=A0AAD5BJR3_9ASCO|nr:uncharacterized protein KGF57_000031 [Candida theae]KAI5968916.1 hypothetical protein KGF57_000031 [Candida theae]
MRSRLLHNQHHLPQSKSRISRMSTTPNISTASSSPLSFHARPHLVICDWDETLTTKDTIQYLAQVPYINSPQLRPRFSHYTDIYMSHYEKYKSQFGASRTKNGNVNNNSLTTKMTIDDYVEFQRGMGPVEMSSITALESDEVFRGLTELQIRQHSAPSVKLRDGAVEFLNRCMDQGIEVVVLSVNWTSLLIDEVLRQNGFSTKSSISGMSEKSEVEVGKIKIVTNEFEFDSAGKTTGNWLPQPKIRTSQDKLDYVNKLKTEYQKERAGRASLGTSAGTIHNGNVGNVGEGNMDDTDDVNIMYIGDSLTDLLPVLNVAYPCAIKDTKLDKTLTELQFEHFSGTWFDFMRLV